jgi:methylglutaconyl-CoA hydratase
MKYVDYSVEDRVGFITMNRPDKRNALSHELVSDLQQAFAYAESDAAAKVLILRANGAAFCAGADLDYLQQLQQFSYEQNFSDSSHLKNLFHQIYTLKKVVIAQIEGHAVAGGCGLATVCDFSFAVPDARLGYTEVRIGFIPAIVMVFLIRKVGEGKARELFLTGSLISAEEARVAGLVNRVIKKEIIKDEVLKFAQQLVQSNSEYSMAVTKQMIAKVQSLALDDALTFAAEMNAKARESADCRKGISAYVNKEKITW